VCLDSTVRFAAELGYEVTVIRDATASFSDEQMHAVLAISLPNYATAIASTRAVVESLAGLDVSSQQRDGP
jgi:nicotinamidase-related amidase